jgi:hypothetical protein
MKFINDNISKVIYETEEEEKGDRQLFVIKKLPVPFFLIDRRDACSMGDMRLPRRSLRPLAMTI